MASKQLLILSVVVAAVAAAPQVFRDDQLPIPHDFSYGVQESDTGDAKEHKQSVSPSGRTEGEYRWLLPNGLFNVVRYYVDGDSGFQAQVSEEPGPAVGNYYANSLSQETSSGVVSLTPQVLTRSSNLQQPSVGRIDVISASRPNQVFSSVPAFNVQQQNFGGVIDGGFIDGGIIDGGIIDGGIIDGGIIDDSVVSGGFSSNFDNSFENSAVILARDSRLRG
ncbi:uncharacterized protein LOC122247000 isoform X7 [Penaeus japonicus]|uniref:uncharacterized protein LOC122247000 isoform X7 n=1 Tax=Penaeus japonicus TaxID=27405 RepID=UPI001C716B96|nr:uncharacterized protein LOC122247000 isoform X7 [Penaeus japonicus]